jgi:hypothetical protein
MTLHLHLIVCCFLEVAPHKLATATKASLPQDEAKTSYITPASGDGLPCPQSFTRFYGARWSNPLLPRDPCKVNQMNNNGSFVHTVIITHDGVQWISATFHHLMRMPLIKAWISTINPRISKIRSCIIARKVDAMCTTQSLNKTLLPVFSVSDIVDWEQGINFPLSEYTMLGSRTRHLMELCTILTGYKATRPLTAP